MLPTNNDEILSICANFESKDSAGYDEISSTITKSTMQCILSPLTDIIYCLFETGIIPNDLKIAKVIPVYKSGPKNIIPPTAQYLFNHSSHRFLKNWPIIGYLTI